MVKEFHSDIVVLIILNLMELLPMALCNGQVLFVLLHIYNILKFIISLFIL